ncbi:MFS transporter [Actinomadura rupiterrae]|uniref:MFS transporter n=1 Tax=Actinomadura rupiterrae TaxID=559627 RepID=UPI0020A414D9|nr:MFS transporter [Actinomadura rupiterrae]MCP2336996.1 DHA2 family methylenomycin A resistance protein-like MFS transporter [Actinomadura rupiterrae]
MTITATATRAPAGSRTVPLLGVSLGYFMVLLDMTVLSVAEPDLASSLHASTAGLQWATTSYTVVFAALLLTSGAVADRFGAHRMFRAGIAGFGALSLLCAAAPGLWALVALRGLLGIAAAACVPASMAMIARLYPDAPARTRALATWAAVSGSAVAAGPVLGGLLVGAAGWRAVFVVNGPIAVAVLALTAGAAVRVPRGTRRINVRSQLAVCATLGLATDALIAAGARAWLHAALSAAAAIAAAFTLVLLERRSRMGDAPLEDGRGEARERRRVGPVVDPALLRSRGMLVGLGVGAAVNFTLTGDLFVLPLTLHRGPVATGLAILPMTVPFVLGPPITGRLVARFGPRPPLLGGTALLAAGAVLLASHVLTVGLLLTGCGVALALPSLVAAVMAAAPDGTAGSAGGLLNAVRQCGATLGVAVAGAFATSHPSIALLVPGVLCAAAGLALALTGRD